MRVERANLERLWRYVVEELGGEGCYNRKRAAFKKLCRFLSEENKKESNNLC